MDKLSGYEKLQLTMAHQLVPTGDWGRSLIFPDEFYDLLNEIDTSSSVYF